MDRKRTLVVLLGRRDYEKISEEGVKRLEKFLEDASTDEVKYRSMHIAVQKRAERLEKELNKTKVETANSKQLLEAAEINVTELREQLNSASREINLLNQQMKDEESKNNEWLKRRNELLDENTELRETLGRKSSIINDLQADLKSLNCQCNLLLSEKDDAMLRLAEMAAKEQSIDDRDKQTAEKIQRLNNEIAELTANHHRTSAELTKAIEIRSTNSQLEMDLQKMAEELRVAHLTIRQLTETNQVLTNQHIAETVQQNGHESATLIEHFKRELDAKMKLVDLYKANSDECQTEMTLMRSHFKETADKCKQLESKLNDLGTQHRMELGERDAAIEKLKYELKVAGDLLKDAEDEHIEKVLEKKFPRAAVANRMLQDNLSLTEIFGRYHDSLGEIHRLEVECLRLNGELKCVTQKLTDSTSAFERQRVEYGDVLKLNGKTTQEMKTVVAEQIELRKELKETSSKLANVANENVHLKSTQKDLARQICNLLYNVETSSDQQQLKQFGLSSETIKKEPITFDNIVELQENNQKLLLKVRELSNKVEKLEERSIGMKCYEEKVSNLEKRLSDAERVRQDVEALLTMTTKQKERFEQLYFEAISYMEKQKPIQNVDVVQTATDLQQQDRAIDYKILMDGYDEQYAVIERRFIELQSENSKLQSQVNITNEQMKTQRSDIVIYKKQIQILEERNQMYDKTIAKHELANKQLNEELWNKVRELSTAENRCDFLEMECRRLLEVKTNLEMEKNGLRRQEITQSILKSSRELAEISSKRIEFEGRIQMEKQVEDQVRRYEILQRKLNDEQNRFTEEIESMKRQLETAIRKLTDEQTQTEALRTKLSTAREQIDAKNQELKNLSEKLETALTASSSSHTLSRRNHSSKELETELKSLTIQLKLQSGEIDELKSRLKIETDALKVSGLNESKLKSQIDELQQVIRLQLTNANAKTSNATTQSKIQAEYKKAVEQVVEANKELQELRIQFQKLKENLQIVETNYANEMLAHSVDLQELTARKEQLSKCQEEMSQLRSDKDEAVDELKANRLEWEATSKKSIDGRQELERKIESLEKQMMELVELMGPRNTKPLPFNVDLLSTEELNDDQLTEIPSKTLFQFVKYFRREKEIAAVQSENLSIENARLKAELDIQMNRINQLTEQLNSIESITSINNENYVLTPLEIDELRQKVQTLNAITDSNIHLRAEKDNLDVKVRDLTEKVSQLEETNGKLVQSSDGSIEEINLLRSNVDKLKSETMSQQREYKMLAKRFADEKERLRQANEELNSMKPEKSQTSNDLREKLKREVAESISKMNEMEAEIQVTKNRLKKSEENQLRMKKENERLYLELQRMRAKSSSKKRSDSQESLETTNKDDVSSTETVTSMVGNNSKRLRDLDDDKSIKDSLTPEKLSPPRKRNRLRRSSPVVNSTKTAIDEGIDGQDEVALPGADLVSVDQKQNFATDNGSPSSVVEDMIIDVESNDSGRVSSELTEMPESATKKPQAGRRTKFQRNDSAESDQSQATSVRRGRSRLKLESNVDVSDQ